MATRVVCRYISQFFAIESCTLSLISFFLVLFFFFFFFFFQAEDGIRDKLVTGVQTCALPISYLVLGSDSFWRDSDPEPTGKHPAAYDIARRRDIHGTWYLQDPRIFAEIPRSEERRVGKECRSRWWRYH